MDPKILRPYENLNSGLRAHILRGEGFVCITKNVWSQWIQDLDCMSLGILHNPVAGCPGIAAARLGIQIILSHFDECVLR